MGRSKTSPRPKLGDVAGVSHGSSCTISEDGTLNEPPPRPTENSLSSPQVMHLHDGLWLQAIMEVSVMTGEARNP